MPLTFACSLVAAAAARHWQAGPPVLEPGPAGAFDETAVKDPSIVESGGQWHVFFTARGRRQYTLGYVSAPSLTDLRTARRYQLVQLRSRESAYAAAPQVFYFRPQKKWYLIFQSTDSNYQPMFSTNASIGDSASWTSPLPLANKTDPAKWLDFWILRDGDWAYLYFTRDHTDLNVMRTHLADFPNGFGGMQSVFAPLHEAAHIYKVRGKRQFAMLYEINEQGKRSYGLATAASPVGPWERAPDAFAASAQLEFPGTTWTTDVSHGELLRSGADERMEADLAHPRFLIQGLPPGLHHGDYAELPWRLGLITTHAPGPRP